MPYIKQINNRQNGITWAKKASTAFAPGIFVQIDGTTGFVEPAANNTPILGLCNEKITATSPNYATNDRISISEAVYNDEFEIPIDQGSATMEGRYVALAAGGGSVVAAGISATCSVATPILVVKYINATTIIGKVAWRF